MNNQQSKDPGYTEWAERLDVEDIKAQEAELQNQQAEQLISEENDPC